MGWLPKFLSRKSAVTTSLDLFRQVYGGRESSAGIAITMDRALEVSVIVSICRVLSDGVAQVPFRLYRQVNGSREIASSHSLAGLLSARPNAFQSSFEFRETMMFHLLLTGNAFVFLNRVGIDRRIKEMVLLLPGAMTVKREADGTLVYKYRAENGQEQMIPAAAIWHVRGPSWNAWYGMDSVKLARNAIGLSLALEDAHSSMHRNGARTSGLLSVKDPLSPEQYAFLAGWLDKYEIGGERYQKAMLLDRGAEFTPFSMSGVDTQHLETRKFQIEELCRFWRVMPIMVGFSDKTATYASSEQMFLAHVVHTLAPWYSRLEQSADCNLLTADELAGGFYTKFQPNGLMRGAAKDRGEFYAKGLGSGGGKGWLTQNDVRDMEDMNRSDDPEADKLPQPVAAVAQTTTSNSPESPQ